MTLEQFLTTVGGIAQLAGLAVIVIEVRDVDRKLLGKPSLEEQLADAVRAAARRFRDAARRLTGKPRVDARAGPGTVGVTTHVGSGTGVARHVVVDTSPEARLSRLERQVESHTAAIDALRNDIATEADDREAALQAQAADLRGSVDAVDRRYLELATGGLTFKRWSVLMLAGGIILTTWPGQIADLFR